MLNHDETQPPCTSTATILAFDQSRVRHGLVAQFRHAVETILKSKNTSEWLEHPEIEPSLLLGVTSSTDPQPARIEDLADTAINLSLLGLYAVQSKVWDYPEGLELFITLQAAATAVLSQHNIASQYQLPVAIGSRVA